MRQPFFVRARPILVATLTLVAHCSSNTDLGFDITRAIASQTVPGNPVAHAAGSALDTTPFNPVALNIDLGGEASAHGTGPIQHVHLTALTFTIHGAGCWDFVDSISISVESTRSGTSLPPVVVATGSHPGCIQTFALTPDSTRDLQPYIAEGVRLTSAGHGIPPAQDTTFDGSVVLRASVL